MVAAMPVRTAHTISRSSRRRPLRRAPRSRCAQHGVDDAAMKADQQHHAVGHLARELDGLGSRRRHQERHRSARRVREPAGRAVEVDGVAGEQLAQILDTGAHLGERGRLATDRARRRVARADHDLGATGRELGDGLDRAGQHRDVARERIGHRREQGQRATSGSRPGRASRTCRGRVAGCRGCRRRRSRPSRRPGSAGSAPASARCPEFEARSPRHVPAWTFLPSGEDRAWLGLCPVEVMPRSTTHFCYDCGDRHDAPVHQSLADHS